MPIFTSEVDVVTTAGLTDAELRATPVPIDGSGVTQPVSGTVAVSSVAGSVAVTGPLTDTQLRATPVPISGSVSTTPLSSNTSTVTQITSTGASQTILAANANRKKAILFFESGIWRVKLGATASTTSLTYLINSSNTSLEVTVWTGTIDAICTTAGKLVDVTELA